MSRAASEHAATTLRRLRREQDAHDEGRAYYVANAAGIGHHVDHDAMERVSAAYDAEHGPVMATSRGEAARAVILIGEDETAAPRDRLVATIQFRYLTSSAPIPSATLAMWADGWDAYAVREAAAADGRTAP